MIRPEVNLWWEPREPAQANDARRLARFVSGLPGFDPIYESWLESPKSRKELVPIPLSEPAATQLLTDRMSRYEIGGAPWPELGSNIWGGHAGPPPYDFRTSSYADTSCHVGQYGRSAAVNPNHIFMRLSERRSVTERPWRASEVRPLMKFARDVWAPAICARPMPAPITATLKRRLMRVLPPMLVPGVRSPSP